MLNVRHTFVPSCNMDDTYTSKQCYKQRYLGLLLRLVDIVSTTTITVINYLAVYYGGLGDRLINVVVNTLCPINEVHRRLVQHLDG